MAPRFKHSPVGVQASDASAGGMPALDDALPPLAPSLSSAAYDVRSWRRSSTANQSSFDTCLAFVRMWRLRCCAFFNSAATRLRSACMRACSAFMSAFVWDREVIALPASPVPARSCVPTAATWLSAELAATPEDATGASPSLPHREPGMAQTQLRLHWRRARRGAHLLQPRFCCESTEGASAPTKTPAQQALARAHGVQACEHSHHVLSREMLQTARQMEYLSLLARYLGVVPTSAQKHSHPRVHASPWLVRFSP